MEEDKDPNPFLIKLLKAVIENLEASHLIQIEGFQLLQKFLF